MTEESIYKEKHILKNINFFILWFGQLITTIGTSFYRIAYMWWIASKTDSAMAISKVVMIGMLPGVLLGLIAGKLVDMCNKKYIIVITDLLQGLVIFWIFFLSYRDLLKIHHIYISAFISSVMITFFRPAISTSIPLMVKKEKLIQANSLLSFNSSLGSIIAPAIGGVLIISFGIEYAFLINSITFIFSGISEMFLTINSKRIKKLDEPKKTFYANLKKSIILIGEMKIAWYIIVIFLIINFSLTVLNYLPILIKLMGFTSKEYGYLRSAEGIGMLTVSILLGIFTKEKKDKFIKILSIAFIILPVSMLILSLSNKLSISLISQYLIGACVGLGSILLNTIFQIYVPQNNMGLLYGLRSTLLDLFIPMGLFISGYIGDIKGVQKTIILFAIISAIALYPLKKLGNKMKEVDNY